MGYNWQLPDWPNFHYELSQVQGLLGDFVKHSSRVHGILEALPEDLGVEAILDLMISEAIKSSAIEGENLEREAVMSSIKNRLGLNPEQQVVRSRLADGAGELMIAVRDSFAEPLTQETLFSWHRMLLEGTSDVKIGGWREGTERMQVVSGRIDRPTVHFEAPPSDLVPGEMELFIQWFNRTAANGYAPIVEAPVRAAVAHLYFESIHPFEDGNGRIGRAVAEKALSQGVGHPVVLSLSQAIEEVRNDYYEALKSAQGSNEITDWVTWFVRIVLKAQIDAEAQITFVLRKSKFFMRFQEQLNGRHVKVLQRMFEAGPKGFEGGVNARKYIALTGASKATATRDLQYLSQIGALTTVGGGRSVRYNLAL